MLWINVYKIEFIAMTKKIYKLSNNDEKLWWISWKKSKPKMALYSYRSIEL